MSVKDLQKWTSDSELYKADQEDDQEVAGEENWKTLQLPSRNNLSDQDSTEHPLRRSRAQVELSSSCSEPSCEARPASRALPSYSQHEMEDWILEHDPSPSESEETGGATALPAISENSYESDDDEDLFSPGIYTPDGQEEEEETAESGAEEEEEDADKNLMDTEFTRDYYRLVKFESNRSLANSEKYDHCPAETEQTPVVAAGPLLPPPDRQVALQTVLDFIAEQQRYCAIRETADADAANATPVVESSSSVSSSLLQLRHLIDDEEDEDESDEDEALHDGISTNWLPVHGSRAELVDLNNAEVIFPFHNVILLSLL